MQQDGISRELALVFIHHLFGALMQVAGAGVITEASPVLHDLPGRCGGQVKHGRKSFQEACVIRDYCRDLRLLQHDFRQPDAISLMALLPGQAVTAMLFLPGDERCRKTVIDV
ncbi:hypothetical protein UNDYM_0615 [Undibacterium sp. YM2]|nr:hypothetical protein UNDYM_0615 [Undibacterium sp. YM2]